MFQQRFSSKKHRNIQSAKRRASVLRNAIEVLEGRVLLAYTLDPTFDGDGKVTGPAGSAVELELQSDGKMVVGVSTEDAPDYLLRYNPNGSLDTTFGGGDGRVDLPADQSIQGLALSGSKIVAGLDTNPDIAKQYVYRFNSDGSLDTTFGGGDGQAEVPGGLMAIWNVDVQDDGKIVLSGSNYSWFQSSHDPTTRFPTWDSLAVSRLNADGSPDTSFDIDGSSWVMSDAADNYPLALGIQPGTGIIVVGGTDSTSHIIVGFSPTTGRAVFFTRVPYDDLKADIAALDFQPDGSIVVVASGANTGSLIRFTPAGQLDPTFIREDFADRDLNDVKVLSNGSILATGTMIDGTTRRAHLMRFTPNGAIDTSFAPGGLVTANWDTQSAATDVEVSADNKPVIAGYGWSSSLAMANVGLARFADDGKNNRPHNGAPFNVGATIQSEDFDNGGEGVAYHDTETANNGGQYRPTEAVDIEATSDTGGGYDVGWTIPGEWMEYTFNTPTAGTFAINTRLASPKTGGSFHYEIDGRDVTGSLNIPNTGSFQSFRTITSNLGSLGAGTHVLRLVIDSSANPGGQANFNWMQIIATSTSDTQAPSAVPNFHTTNVTNSSVSLAWDAATDNVGVTGYEISSDAFPPTLLGPDQRSFTYNELAPDRQYTFNIRAIDAAGNQGPISQVTATTGSLPVTGGLKGEYFNNSDFTAPVLTRNDPNIDFNWGTGSPDSRIDPDTFSVRWTGKIQVPTTGRYTFYTTTDDGVRLWVNNQLLIDKLQPQAATEWSGSIDLVAGQKYDIRMDYFERAGGAQAKLSWDGPSIAKQIVPPSAFSNGSGTGDTQAPSAVPNFGVRPGTITSNSVGLHWDGATDNVGVTGYELRINDANPLLLGPTVRNFDAGNLQPNTPYKFTISAFDAAGNHGPLSTTFAQTSASSSGNGLSGTYFNNMDFTSPVFTRRDPTINFNWGTGSPGAGIDPDTFSVRWTGQIQAPTTGRYTFYTTSDDGMRLTINGQRIIDKLGPQSTTEWSGSIDLVAGQKYNLTLEYIERAGGANAKLQWSGPGITKQVVPQVNLFS